MPVKSPYFALFDLAEGKTYSFRVRCCNSAGVGEASVSTEEITVGDKLGETFLLLYVPADCTSRYCLLARCSQPCFLSYIFFFSTDLPATPGHPVAIRNTDTSVVVTYGASKDVRHLVGYYIEYSEVGTDVWMPCNNKPVKQTRYITQHNANMG